MKGETLHINKYVVRDSLFANITTICWRVGSFGLSFVRNVYCAKTGKTSIGSRQENGKRRKDSHQKPQEPRHQCSHSVQSRQGVQKYKVQLYVLFDFCFFSSDTYVSLLHLDSSVLVTSYSMFVLLFCKQLVLWKDHHHHHHHHHHLLKRTTITIVIIKTIVLVWKTTFVELFRYFLCWFA